jgi:RNA polymerase sigma factor (sigma-70 family)
MLGRMTEATRILNAIEAGDPAAAAQLLPLVYDELRSLAAQKLAQEKPGHTLQPTALVHEVYLRLIGSTDERRGLSPPDCRDVPGGSYQFANRRHFFAAAAEAMRRILVENARRKHRLKRGGDIDRVELPDVAAPLANPNLLALDEALTLLGAEDPRKLELVKLRYFAGLSVEDAARCLSISRATADRWWAYARAWLNDKIQANPKNR